MSTDIYGYQQIYHCGFYHWGFIGYFPTKPILTDILSIIIAPKANMDPIYNLYLAIL